MEVSIEREDLKDIDKIINSFAKIYSNKITNANVLIWALNVLIEKRKELIEYFEE